jgi:hypothetical protein
MVLYALYVCLLHSLFVKNHPIWILEDGPLIFEVVLSHRSWPPLLPIFDVPTSNLVCHLSRDGNRHQNAHW